MCTGYSSSRKSLGGLYQRKRLRTNRRSMQGGVSTKKTISSKSVSCEKYFRKVSMPSTRGLTRRMRCAGRTPLRQMLPYRKSRRSRCMRSRSRSTRSHLTKYMLSSRITKSKSWRPFLEQTTKATGLTLCLRRSAKGAKNWSGK